jgi:uncharacterized protein (DUF924 family)
MDDALRVREFWFGKSLTGIGPGHAEMASRAHELSQRNRLWFETNPQRLQLRDEEIRKQFAALLERAARGELSHWADSPRRCLSLIILLDQFPRQIYRGTARAFAYDSQALGFALHGMQSAADGALNIIERLFFYMPLQHAESLEVQDEAVAAYRRLAGEAPLQLRSTFAAALESAEEHRQIIRQFGRFPHRNAVLNRPPAEGEVRWLKENPQAFGQ